MERNNSFVSNSETDFFVLIKSALNVLKRIRYKDKNFLHRVTFSFKFFLQRVRFWIDFFKKSVFEKKFAVKKSRLDSFYNVKTKNLAFCVHFNLHDSAGNFFEKQILKLNFWSKPDFEKKTFRLDRFENKTSTARRILNTSFLQRVKFTEVNVWLSIERS